MEFYLFKSALICLIYLESILGFWGVADGKRNGDNGPGGGGSAHSRPTFFFFFFLRLTAEQFGIAARIRDFIAHWRRDRIPKPVISSHWARSQRDMRPLSARGIHS